MIMLVRGLIYQVAFEVIAGYTNVGTTQVSGSIKCCLYKGDPQVIELGYLGAE